MLQPVEGRVIHNGVDLTVYQPADRHKVRRELGLPVDAVILLFVAHNVKSRFKDYATIRDAIASLNLSDGTSQQVLFLALGGKEVSTEKIGSVDVQTIPFQSDPARVAQYFQAADIFLHAAHADNFPNTILESLACGTPVIATAVGGIPEQIEDGETGFLVPPQDSSMMAQRIRYLLQDDALRQRMSIRAAAVAKRDFDLERQADDYLDWYEDILTKDV
jgi:glycosyltransferase involved in cell wall biosynthesis